MAATPLGLNAHVASAPSARRASGGARRKWQNELPQDFFLYSWRSSHGSDCVGENHAIVYGVVTLHGVRAWDVGLDLTMQAQLDQLGIFENVVAWEVGKFAALPVPIALPSTASASWKPICRLKSSRAVLDLHKACGVRAAPSGIRCFRIQGADLADAVFNMRARYIVTPGYYCNAAGVAVPPLSGAPSSMTQTPPGEVAEDGAVEPDYRAVKHVFKPSVLLRAWQMRVCLASEKVPLHYLARLAAKMLLSAEETLKLETALDSGSLVLPGREVLREATFRVNLLDLAYQRKLVTTQTGHRHLLADASQLRGYNFYIIQEDRELWPDGTALEDKLRSPTNIEERFLPTTTFGLGGATFCGKVCNTMHACMLECGGDAALARFRNEVYSWTADQGIEADVVDAPFLADCRNEGWATFLARARDSDFCPNSIADAAQFLFPRALGFNDCLHMFYNALERATTSSPIWEWLGKAYQTIAVFLGHKDMRSRFVAMCLSGPGMSLKRALFATWPHGTRFTWKWEYLRGFVLDLLRVLPTLAEAFDANAMRRGVGDAAWNASEVNATVIAEMEKVLAESRKLLVQSTILGSISSAVQAEANWQERCWCHEGVFANTALPWHERLRKYRQEARSCQWKCRRAAELAAGGADQSLNNILRATSKGMTALLMNSSPAERQEILSIERALKLTIVEQLRLKLAPWSSLPLKLLGVWAYTQTGNLERSQRICAECIAERDQAVASDRISRLHRVVQRLLVDESLPFRREFEMFARGEARELGPHAAFELKQYCMSPTVTRKTEGAHSLVKSHLNKAQWMLPSLINSKLKRRKLANQLDDPKFFAFVVGQWRSRNLIRNLLKFTFPPRDRWRAAILPRSEAVGRLYLFSTEAQFRDLSEEATALQTWKKDVVPVLKPLALPILIANRNVVAFLQSKLADSAAVWSLPRVVFAHLVGLADFAAIRDLSGDRAVVELALEVVSHPPKLDFHGELAFFQVVNNCPANAKVARPAHLDMNRFSATIVELRVAKVSPEDESVEIEFTGNTFLSLDLDKLAEIGAPECLFKWQTAWSSSWLEFVPEVVSALQGLQQLDITARPLPQALSFVRRLADLEAIVGAGEAVLLSPLLRAEGDQESMSLSVLECLRHLDAIELTTSEFLEDLVRLRPESISWAHTAQCVYPTSCMNLHCSSVNNASPKLELFLEMARLGWAASGDELESFAPGRPRRFDIDALRRSANYMRALLSADAIFDRGYLEILHGMPDAYYKVLIREDRATDINACADLRALRNVDFERMLGGASLPELGALAVEDIAAPACKGIEDEVGELVCAVPADEVLLPVPPFPLAMALPVARFPVAPPLVRVSGIDVHFDGCSHSSGIQRGYVRCLSATHYRCFKYRQIPQFPDWQTCAAWLACWAKHGSAEADKADHGEYEPWPADVDAARRELS